MSERGAHLVKTCARCAQKAGLRKKACGNCGTLFPSLGKKKVAEEKKARVAPDGIYVATRPFDHTFNGVTVHFKINAPIADPDLIKPLLAADAPIEPFDSSKKTAHCPKCGHVFVANEGTEL